eukprot:Skav215334  [mRNA]  locus=scaffold1391:139181:150355:- [translate_table: standard]
MEFNASDARSKAVIDSMTNSLAGSLEFSGLMFVDCNKTLNFGKGAVLQRSAIIMDECDGMTGGDKGGVQALMSLIQVTKNPVICICNDRSDAQVPTMVQENYLRPFEKRRSAEDDALDRAAQASGLIAEADVMSGSPRPSACQLRGFKDQFCGAWPLRTLAVRNQIKEEDFWSAARHLRPVELQLQELHALGLPKDELRQKEDQLATQWKDSGAGGNRALVEEKGYFDPQLLSLDRATLFGPVRSQLQLFDGFRPGRRLTSDAQGVDIGVLVPPYLPRKEPGAGKVVPHGLTVGHFGVPHARRMTEISFEDAIESQGTNSERAHGESTGPIGLPGKVGWMAGAPEIPAASPVEWTPKMLEQGEKALESWGCVLLRGLLTPDDLQRLRRALGLGERRAAEVGLWQQQQDPNVAMGRYTYGRLHLLLRGTGVVTPVSWVTSDWSC